MVCFSFAYERERETCSVIDGMEGGARTNPNPLYPQKTDIYNLGYVGTFSRNEWYPVWKGFWGFTSDLGVKV
jgi:hypothetical protein